MTRPRPTVLVTGAAGFAGGHLLERLGGLDVDLVAWRRAGSTPPPERAPAARPQVEWREVDLLDPASIDAAVGGRPPDQVYHLAGATHQGRSFTRATDALRVNALGTHHLLSALARHAPDARVLVTTTGFVYQPSETAVGERAPLRPASPYALSKLAQEMVARHAGQTSRLAVIVCRPFNHIGPRQSPDFFAPAFARQVARIVHGRMEPVLKVGNLSARRDLSDVRDVVQAYVQLMASGTPGEVYNVCSGRAREIREVLDGLIRRSGISVQVQVAPELLRPVDQPLLLGDPAKVQAATGWRPAIPMEETLGDLLDEWLAKPD